MFIDNARIFIKAGNGGNGIVSFHREKYVTKGGPDGGDGGRGGDVIFVVDEGMRTLADFRYKRHYKAEPGADGGASNCSGRSGDDLIIRVPPGTIIKDEQTGRVLTDLTKAGQTVIIAKGGKGGAGNQHFATSTRQIPQFAKCGEEGEEYWVILELKMLADVGLLGFPNVGKSTVLSMVSSARPKIANYPFTTLTPNLGVVSYDSQNSFVIADIPGLIEGAHEGTGLGHEFLKHIERTRLLIHIVDIAAIEGRDPINDFEVINKELENYSKKLYSKIQVIAVNKIDISESKENLDKFAKYAEEKGYKIFPISAATNTGLSELMLYVGQKLKEIPSEILIDENSEPFVYTVADEEPFKINKENNVFKIEGKWIKKVIMSTNINNSESLQYFQRLLKNKGVIGELEKMGINEGDTVKIYDIEFEYIR